MRNRYLGDRAAESVVNGYTFVLKWCTVQAAQGEALLHLQQLRRSLRPPLPLVSSSSNSRQKEQQQQQQQAPGSRASWQWLQQQHQQSPAISNCVGLRNRRSFFIFILFCNLLCCSLALATASAVAAEVGRCGLPLGFSSAWQVLTTRRALGFEAACCLVASLPLLNLLGYNCYLIAKNLTTAEEFHRPYGDANPFSEGCKTNCLRFWCSRVAPRAVDFRGFVDADPPAREALFSPPASNWRQHVSLPQIQPEEVPATIAADKTS
ncbi:hypothetical protein Efla_006439 [Eimeria flavescens]